MGPDEDPQIGFAIDFCESIHGGPFFLAEFSGFMCSLLTSTLGWRANLARPSHVSVLSHSIPPAYCSQWTNSAQNIYSNFQQKYCVGNSSLTRIRHEGLEELTLSDLKTCRLICKASTGPFPLGIHEI